MYVYAFKWNFVFKCACMLSFLRLEQLKPAKCYSMTLSKLWLASSHNVRIIMITHTQRHTRTHAHTWAGVIREHIWMSAVTTAASSNCWEREKGECMGEMGGGESYESSHEFRMCLFERRGDERRRTRRLHVEDRLLRGEKNKPVAFLIEESLKEGVVKAWSEMGGGWRGSVKAKLSHFFTPISCDSSHSGSRHRMELCVSLCKPSSAAQTVDISTLSIVLLLLSIY